MRGDSLLPNQHFSGKRNRSRCNALDDGCSRAQRSTARYHYTACRVLTAMHINLTHCDCCVLSKAFDNLDFFPATAGRLLIGKYKKYPSSNVPIIPAFLARFCGRHRHCTTSFQLLWSHHARLTGTGCSITDVINSLRLRMKEFLPPKSIFLW